MRRQPLARGPVRGAAAAVSGLLLALSGRYGYHRDELYFLQAGRHLAWGYPDQPPLVPLIARVMSGLAPDSVVVLRLPSTLTAAAIVVLTGLIAGELGGGRAEQGLAAGCAAASAVVLATCHLLSTATYGLLAWTALSALLVRLLLGSEQRLWLAAGLVAGVGMLANPLVAVLGFGVLAGVLIAGPREVLRSRWLWAGALLAALIAAPYLAWQAGHGWPQLEISRAIAAGSSGTSEPRALFLPYQLVLVSPVLVPIWVAGLVRLFRDPALCRLRALAWAYPVLAVVFVVTGGKPYYLAGLYPLLLAAGAAPAVAWAGRRRRRLRRWLLAAAVVFSVVVGGTVTLPVLPLDALAGSHLVAVSYDLGEQVGWPRFAAVVDGVYAGLPPSQRATAVIFTSNYGEAGAVDHYGRALGLPRAYSGHNGYWYWGPPPQTGGPTLAVGFSAAELSRYWTSITPAATITNGHGVDNDEEGNVVYLCRGQPRPWAAIWPGLRQLG